ncbi:hypothetical protein P4C99_21995, partial [Pontiellaceae bacterium B1224]|nr:hypothetical protein [Pontiellaceae bacterium B1224]
MATVLPIMTQLRFPYGKPAIFDLTGRAPLFGGHRKSGVLFKDCEIRFTGKPFFRRNVIHSQNGFPYQKLINENIQ